MGLYLLKNRETDAFDWREISDDAAAQDIQDILKQFRIMFKLKVYGMNPKEYRERLQEEGLWDGFIRTRYMTKKFTWLNQKQRWIVCAMMNPPKGHSMEEVMIQCKTTKKKELGPGTFRMVRKNPDIPSKNGPSATPAQTQPKSSPGSSTTSTSPA